MTKRFDVLTPRPKKDGGTYWHRVGTAFEGERGINIVLDSLPIPDKEGRCAMSLFEPREPRAASERPARKQAASQTQRRDDMDDEIPI